MIITKKINGKKITLLKPDVFVQTYSTAPTVTPYVSVIDWFFPQPKKNERPAKYVGRVARFMRQWNNLTMREAAEKFKMSYMTLHRIETGKWQSIKTTNRYLIDAYGLQMKLDFAPIADDKVNGRSKKPLAKTKPGKNS